jgi:hypothetical protein
MPERIPVVAATLAVDRVTYPPPQHHIANNGQRDLPFLWWLYLNYLH